MEQKKERLKWARDHSSWTSEDWRNVLWSDETKFCLVKSEGKEYVWVKEEGRLGGDAVIGTNKYGGGKIMMWGCMSWEGVGFACRIESTMDAELYSDILKEELMETIKYYKLDQKKVIFQQDRDPKHTSKLATSTLAELKLNILPWPAQSPDLNPIEYLWNHVQRNLRIHSRIFGTKDELWDQIQVEMEERNKELCRKLIGTMPERVRDVIKANGGYTRW